MLKRIGATAIAVQAFVLAVLLLAPEVDAFLSDGWAGVGGYGVEAVTFPLSHTTTTPPTPGAPVITSFTPTSGEPGIPVQINGANFVGVTSVTFGGVPATGFFFLPDSAFVKVPFGAVTGPISVTNSHGTGVSHDNFNVTPFVMGGRNLEVAYPPFGLPDEIRVSWSGGSVGQEYYALWIDITSGAPPVSIGPFPGHYLSDTIAPVGSLICYIVTPMLNGAVIGWSDPECVMKGIRDGALAPANMRLSLAQSNTAHLSWWGVPDAGYIVGILPLDGSPASTVLVPPGGFLSYSHDTGGVATCYLIAGVKVGPPQEFGISNLLCGFPGVSSLGLTGEPARSQEDLARRVQQALAGLKAPDLQQVVESALEHAVRPTE